MPENDKAAPQIYQGTRGFFKAKTSWNTDRIAARTKTEAVPAD